jgi:L-threonylcarbamoyladenylate synthase
MKRTDNSIDISKALDILKGGGVILSSTDTVWGLMCDFENIKAVSRIFKMKKSEPRPMAVLCDNFKCLEQLEVHFTAIARRIADHFWPGPITLVLKSDSHRIGCVSKENNTIGVRFPDCRDLKELIRDFGKPLAATSANYVGQKPPRLFSEIPDDVISEADFTCEFNIKPSGISSTVIDCASDKLKLIRRGAVTYKDIQRVLGVYE